MIKERLRSILILFGVLTLGSVAKFFIPLPIPDMIYAMFILFVLMLLKIVKAEHIDHTAAQVLSIFAFFFIPAGVGLMQSYSMIQTEVVKVLIVLSVSFVITLLSVAYTVKGIKAVQNRRRQKTDRHNA